MALSWEDVVGRRFQPTTGREGDDRGQVTGSLAQGRVEPTRQPA